MPEYDETAEPAEEQSAVATAATDEVATAATDESVEAAPSNEESVKAAVANTAAPQQQDDDFDPVQELRQKLRYAPGDWYVVHSYAGYENKVKTNLETRITSLDMEDFIFQVEVPTREEVEVKNGKRQQVNNKVFPG